MHHQPEPPDDGDRRPFWPLVLPALAAWATTLALLSCPSIVSAAVAVCAVLSAAALAWHTRSEPTRARGTQTGDPDRLDRLATGASGRRGQLKDEGEWPRYTGGR
uniref:hypothetical protein n=1 Tax=Nonomuraea pusilla TaxID=46177 RepID=UPI001F350EE3